MDLKQIAKTTPFWEIIGFNLIPFTLVLVGYMEFYHFLLYFVFEVVFVGLFSVVKWFCFFKGSPFISRLFVSLVFMGLTAATYGIAALFVLGMAEEFNPEPRSRIDLIERLYNSRYIIGLAFLRILVYHIQWVRNKEYDNTTILKQLYIMLITGFGGLLVFFGIVNALDKQIVNQPALVAALFTILVLAYELWNKDDPKKWMRAG